MTYNVFGGTLHLASYKNSSHGELGLREEATNVWSVRQV